ncbi:hypothetical protein AUC68_07060 [Methyloceanibacter methanicus]|uniref:Phage tail tape measure protein domain-containing protein n=1 Tax=Methyloceanibacter methanicus TaxID=1774968 RepID=A0A1E3VZJ0_9HYPH|nr:phage tail tape measure protein [Methyloceanibacter methanicus]ODR98923.1 hypothetical protein AUC68_07060 [Methyloceanibacter methanicus]
MTDLHARAIITAVDKVSGPLGAIAGKVAAVHKGMAASVGAAGVAMAAAGRNLMFATTLPAGVMVKQAAEWQTAMLGWKKAADELNDPEVYEQARQEIKSLATRLPLSQAQLTDLATAASRVGVAFKDVSRFVELAAKTADAFDMDATSAGDALSSIKESAGLSNDQLNVLIGRMDLLENSMNVRGKQLIDYTNDIGALGRQAGFTNAQIAVLGATMIAAGSDASDAATSSKNLFKTLTGGTALSKENLKVFKRLGIDADAFAKQVQKEPVKALGMLRDRLNEVIPAHQRLGALFSLFKDQAAPAIALLFQNWDKYRKGLKLVQDEQKAAVQLDSSFAVTMEGLGKKLKITRNHIVNITDVFASRWMPTIDAALQKATDFMATIEKQPRALQALADGFGLLAAAGPAMWIVGAGLKGLSDAVGTLAKGLGGLSRMGGAARGGVGRAGCWIGAGRPCRP